MNFLLVFIGGGLGSCLRYAISIFVKSKPDSFPWATFSANLISCFLIGLLIGQLSKGELSENQKLLLMTGFCGGFSTFSTFGAEVLQLAKGGSLSIAICYVVASVILGSLLVFIGSVFTQS